jgi:protein-S-isoprenylcysteine O-methyltransferase Ste14
MSNTSRARREIYSLSVGTWFDPLVSVLIIVGTFFALYQTALSSVHVVLAITFLTSAYLFVSEVSRAPWRWRDRPRQTTVQVIERTITKFCGVLIGILFIFFLIWLFPHYDNPAKLGYLRQAVVLVFPCIIPVSLVLIFITEYILGEKRDGTYQFGLLARLKMREIDWTIFFDGMREWLLRGFFLLINFFGAVWYVSNYRANGLPDFHTNFPEFIMQLDLAIFGLIVLSILPGYLFASRLINTDLKKVDRTWFGWIINLSCYPPFNGAIFGSLVLYMPAPEMTAIYQGMPAWAYHTISNPPVMYGVAGVIIFMALIHLWGEAIVGIRAANISSRGIITTGPFALTRHPIYVSKGFQWAFLYFPVLNAIGILNMIQSGILFFLVCAIYIGRALGEEKLLATDEKYVRYALYMDEKSIFAFVGRLFPIMTFRWRYEYWKKNGQIQVNG